MAKFTSRADLLIAAGESIKMQEKAGIEPLFKFDGKIEFAVSYNYNSKTNDYEFALSVVEGKPVFVGDELYASGFGKFIVGEKTFYDGEWFLCCSGYAERGGGESHPVGACSWLPTKPKTVMVELPVPVAERWANPEHFSLLSVTDVQEACRKALEKA